MKILKIKIENFKGFNLYEQNLNSESVAIYGQNETGKTTIADAIFWLLFGKDSLNSAKFDIKPLENGVPKMNIDTSVEVQFDTVLLKKTRVEKWVKKRGKSHTFDGYKCKFQINDDRAVKEKEWNEYIRNICNEEKFKLLTNVHHFSKNMHWTDRRKLIFELYGDSKICDEINNKLKRKKNIKSRISEINESIDPKTGTINVRIDEAQKSLVAVPARSNEIEMEFESLVRRKKKIESEIKTIEAGGSVELLRKELLGVENEIRTIEAGIAHRKSDLENVRRNSISDKEFEIKTESRLLTALETDLAATETEIELMKCDLKGLRSEWTEVNNKRFDDVEIEAMCPTCSQPLPANQVQAAIETGKKVFNKQKSDDLESINRRGHERRDKLKALEKSLKDFDDSIKASKAKKEKLEKELEALMNQKITEVEIPGDLEELSLKKHNLQKKIEKAGEDTKVPDELTNELVTVREKIETLKNTLNKEDLILKQNSVTKQRILDYKSEVETLASEQENLECEMNEIEKFVEQEVSKIGEAVNGKFRLTKFKLFDKQINGEIKECCEATNKKGVPYSSCSNGKRINMGMDMIETFSQHFGTNFPILIDNAESVTDLFQTSSQQISFIVEKGQKTLRVERVDNE